MNSISRTKNNKRYFILIAIILLSDIAFFGFRKIGPPPEKSFTNSLGMKMIYIQPGTFMMGAQQDSFQLSKRTDMSKDAAYWDEKPVHKVTISQGFYMAEKEVSIKAFQQFEKDYKGTGYFEPAATGISWNEAHAFCQWLSKKEGKNYRLPTEAEWEYACRAGTNTLFWSGNHMPQANTPNPWGLIGMESGAPEWCYDWHGPYPDTAQTDPVGYDHGWGKVVRGGALETDEVDNGGFKPDMSPAFYRSANRGSLPPDYPQKDANGPRPDFIGFRVVMAPLPKTQPTPFRLGMAFQGVSQRKVDPSVGPDQSQPYFKERQLITSPPDFTHPDENKAVGLNPAIVGKLHSGGLAVCPNGDLLYIAFSSSLGKSESAPNTTMVATRLPYGSQDWETPSLFYDLSGLNDQSALLWNDHGKLWFFGGGRYFGNTPFRFTTSDDNGASWSELKFPVITGKTGPYAPQPITSSFRGPDGTIYFGSDAKGSTSLLWGSHDNGKTWFDTGGRTFGRHTTFALLNDGKILGMGGKNSAVNGYMPQCYSTDFGKTWVGKSASPFAALGSNQRPCILKLKNGDLFFAGDFQNMKMKNTPPPDGITRRGAYVAISKDQGKSWTIKKLPLVPPHNEWKGIVGKSKPQEGWGTLGYCVAAQEPDGIIHLVSSKSFPAMDYEMNEAWILSDYASEVYKDPGEPKAGEIKHFEEKYPDGQLRLSYNGWIAHDGNFLLDGKEQWFYQNGKPQYEVFYHNGHRTGTEKYWRPDGALKWTREHKIYGNTIYTHYWENGQKKYESTWWGMFAHGPATEYDKAGKPTKKMMFYLGKRVE